MKKAYFPLVLILVLAFLIGFIISKMLGSDSDENQAVIKQMQTSTLLSPPKLMPEFSLVNHQGQEFTKASLQGKNSIIFFGYANCPDICPQSLQFLKSVKFKLQQAEKWDEFQVVFVSVDPERDTVEVLSKYVPYFDAEFVGVTGTATAITDFAKTLSMPFSLREKDENGYYDVDHTASLLLTNTQGDVQALISHPYTIEALTSDLLSIVN